MFTSDFLLWDATYDRIYFKLIYIDAAGDFIAGVLLGQIVNWFLPADDGTPKNGPFIERDGRRWLVIARDAWWDEIRISAKQFDRAIKVLQDRGLVDKTIIKYNGNPTVALTFKLDVFDFLRSLYQSYYTGDSHYDS